MSTQAATRASPTAARLLALLALAAALPMLVLATFLFMRNSQAQREAYMLQLQATTRAVSSAIDGQIKQELAILETLRATRALRNHEWGAFYDIAKGAIADEPNARIAVLEPSGQVVVSTLVPYGTSMPMSAVPDVIRRVAETKQVYISDLFVGAVSKSYVLYCYLPVIENGATAYVLALGIPPDRISALLRGKAFPPGVTAVAADRTGTVIARTLSEERFRGQKVVSDFLAAMRLAEEGPYQIRTLEGTPVRGYFVTSALTGWTTALAASQATINAPLWRSLAQLGGGGAVLLLLSFLLTAYSAGRISGPVAKLAAMADSLGRGEVPPTPRLALREAEAIAERMTLAAEALKRLHAERENLLASLEQRVDERTREAAASEARYRSLAAYARSLLEASQDPLVTVSPEGKVTDVNKATEEATGRSRAELVGTDFASYFTEPEKAQAAYREAFAKGQIADFPLELRHRSGAVMDVLYNASVYRDEAGAVVGVFAAARNVTARKRAEESRARALRALNMLNACNNVVIHATDENGLLLDICKTIVGTGGYKLAWVGYAQTDKAKSVRPMAHAGTDGDYVERAAATWGEDERGRGPTGTAIRSGQVVIARNTETAPNYGPWRQRAMERGYRSSATLPLKADGRVYGALMVYAGQPDAFDAEEIRLLNELADDLSYATAALRTKAAQQAAEQELRRASLYARSLLEASLDPLVTISAEGKITDVNKATEDATGRSRGRLIGTDFADYFTEPDKAREGYEKVLSAGSVTDYPLAIRHACGKVTDVLYNASIYRDPTDAAAGVFAAARDVTERKRAERKMASAARYTRNLIEASLDPLVTISAEGKITDVNDATVQATGVARDKLIGSDFADYFTDPDRARAGYRQAFAQGSVRDYPLALRHISGKIMDVLYNATLYRDADGAVAGLFAAARNITEHKRDEEELRKHRLHLEEMVIARTEELAAANASLATANKELEAFSYSVSHDLRTPLRAIDGFSEILLEDYADKLDAEGQRVLNVVRNGAKKMGQLIDDILAFSRAGRLDLSMADVDMEALARAALHDLEPAMAGRNLRIDAKTLPRSYGDAPMLERVWTNLLDNAIKFTRPKAEAAIELGGAIEGKEAVYFVNDNGVGFDMQYVDKLFGVFQRLHGPEEFPGTGIGLAIVKRIVTRHGGRVWAEGKLNEGAKFCFALPVKEKGSA